MIAYVGEHFVPIPHPFICKKFVHLNIIVVVNTVDAQKKFYIRPFYTVIKLLLCDIYIPHTLINIYTTRIYTPHTDYIYIYIIYIYMYIYIYICVCVCVCVCVYKYIYL